MSTAARREPIVVSGPYRCRLHTNEPVSWRGTGCRACASEQHRGRGVDPLRRVGLDGLAHELKGDTR